MIFGGRERDTVCTARKIRLQLIKDVRDMSKGSMLTQSDPMRQDCTYNLALL